MLRSKFTIILFSLSSIMSLSANAGSQALMADSSFEEGRVVSVTWQANAVDQGGNKVESKLVARLNNGEQIIIRKSTLDNAGFNPTEMSQLLRSQNSKFFCGSRNSPSNACSDYIMVSRHTSSGAQASMADGSFKEGRVVSVRWQANAVDQNGNKVESKLVAQLNNGEQIIIYKSTLDKLGFSPTEMMGALLDKGVNFFCGSRSNPSNACSDYIMISGDSLIEDTKGAAVEVVK